MNPIQKLAKLAFENPELRGDLVPLLKKLAGTYTPKDNWVLLDLAVQDAHKGKPAREWYRKDEGYTEVYDRTVKELKRKRRSASGQMERVLKDFFWKWYRLIEEHPDPEDLSWMNRSDFMEDLVRKENLKRKVVQALRSNPMTLEEFEDLAWDAMERSHAFDGGIGGSLYEQGVEDLVELADDWFRGRTASKRKGRRATHRLTQRDIKDAILNNHSILETLKADSDADPRWVAALEKQIEGLRRLLEQAEMKRAIQASKWELADLVETMTSARSTPRDRMAQMDAATKLYERIHGKALNTRPEKEDRDIVDDLKGLDRRGQIQEAKDVSRGVKNPGVLFAMAQAAKDVKAWGAHSTFVYNGIRRLESSPEYKRFIEDLPIRKASDPRLAASHGAQRDLIAVLRGPEMREAVRKAVVRYAANTNRTVVVNAAVEDILNSTSWDTEQLQAVLAKHTAGKETP